MTENLPEHYQHMWRKRLQLQKITFEWALRIYWNLPHNGMKDIPVVYKPTGESRNFLISTSYKVYYKAEFIRTAGKRMERQKELITKYLKIKTKFQQSPRTHSKVMKPLQKTAASR